MDIKDLIVENQLQDAISMAEKSAAKCGRMREWRYCNDQKNSPV